MHARTTSQVGERPHRRFRSFEVVVDNYPDQQSESVSHRTIAKARAGQAHAAVHTRAWIERGTSWSAFQGLFRLFPGNSVRLRYAYVVKCTGCEKDADGKVTAVHCEYIPDTKSGTPGAETVKVKGAIHWLSARHAHAGEVRIYDRLFRVPHPGREHDYIEDLNPESKRTITAQLEAALGDARPEERFQFERHGYFCADARDSNWSARLHRAVTLAIRGPAARSIAERAALSMMISALRRAAVAAIRWPGPDRIAP